MYIAKSVNDFINKKKIFQKTENKTNMLCFRYIQNKNIMEFIKN